LKFLFYKFYYYLVSVKKYYNIKVRGSWEINDGKLELNFDKDYYSDGDMNEEFKIKKVNKEKGYIKIYDGDYDDYIFFDKIKAQNFLDNLNSQ
jgi:hypothetical protein